MTIYFQIALSFFNESKSIYRAPERILYMKGTGKFQAGGNY